MEMLVLNKPRLDFSEVFKPFINVYQNEYHDIYSYESDYDEDFDDDYIEYLQRAYGFYYPSRNYVGNQGIRKIGCSNSCVHPTRRGGKKHSKKYKKSKARVKDYEDISVFDNITNDDSKFIYFYHDINNPDSYELFSSLIKFDDFLTSKGIHVNEYEMIKIMNRDVSHCCSHNIGGELYLLSDHSYSGLYWESCESVDDSSGFWE